MLMFGETEKSKLFNLLIRKSQIWVILDTNSLGLTLIYGGYSDHVSVCNIF